jgi:hypothetical protein
MHDKSRNHKCPTCGRAFADHNISSHSKGVHKVLIRKSRVIRTKRCEDCGAATKHLSRHVCQDKKEKFNCHCGQTFRSRYHLLRHVGNRSAVLIGAMDSGVKPMQPTVGDVGHHPRVRFAARKSEKTNRKRSDIYQLLNN